VIVGCATILAGGSDLVGLWATEKARSTRTRGSDLARWRHWDDLRSCICIDRSSSISCSSRRRSTRFSWLHSIELNPGQQIKRELDGSPHVVDVMRVSATL